MGHKKLKLRPRGVKSGAIKVKGGLSRAQKAQSKTKRDQEWDR